MKNILIICLFTFIVQAAKSQDVIFMKNGDEVTAKVLEVNVDGIKYKKADNPNGPDYTVAKSEVFMIKYANGSKDVFADKATPATAPSDSTNKKAAKKSGSRYTNITQVGYAIGVGGFDYTYTSYHPSYPYSTITTETEHIDNTLKMVQLTTVNAVQVNNYFSAGVGVGIHYYYDQGDHAVTLPVFLDLRGTILGTQNISPVVFFDVGPSIKVENADEMDGVIFEPGAGINIPANGPSFNFSVSYMMQKVSKNGYDYAAGVTENTSSTLKFVSFKAGFVF